MFTACLLVSYFLGIQNNVQVTVAARLIIFLCFAVGLARTLFEQRHLRIRRFTSPTLHVVRQKSMALRKSCKTLRNVWYMSACNGILTGHEAKQP